MSGSQGHPGPGAHPSPFARPRPNPLHGKARHAGPCPLQSARAAQRSTTRQAGTTPTRRHRCQWPGVLSKEGACLHSKSLRDPAAPVFKAPTGNTNSVRHAGDVPEQRSCHMMSRSGALGHDRVRGGETHKCRCHLVGERQRRGRNTRTCQRHCLCAACNWRSGRRSRLPARRQR